MLRPSSLRDTLPAVPVRCVSTSSLLRSPSSRSTGGRPAGRVPPPNTSAAYQRQRRSEWVFVGVAGSAAAFGGWYYWANIRGRHMPDETPGAARTYSTPAARASTFSIPARVRGPGEQPFKVITPLPSAEVDARLRANERSTIVERPPGACLVARYDTNCVPSNDPTEDRHAEVIVERDRAVDEPKSKKGGAPPAADGPRGDLCFFTVMDGHGGPHTAQLLSQKLIAFVALELDKVFRETGEYAQMARSHTSLTSSVWHTLFGSGDRRKEGAMLAAFALDGNPDIVKRALVKGFRGLDKEIVNTPLELLKQYELSLAAAASQGTAPTANDSKNSLSSLAHSIWPSTVQGPSNASSFFTASQASAREALLPALSGSCAQMVYIDSARRDLYVATTGDSRAVAGYWDERAGRWEVEALSVDQTGRNPDEVRRIQREHPPDESATVIQRGRVLGGLEPTRAFGDARYKWDRDMQQRIIETFLPSGKAVRAPPKTLKTPPYVTAEPVVVTRKIPQGTGEGASNESLVAAASESLSSLSGSNSSRELRFIIMATDGLWDLMSDQEAVGLVAGHLAGIRGTVLAADLQQQCFEPSKAREARASAAPPKPHDGSAPPAPADAPEPSTQQHPLLRTPNHLQKFTFEDDNLSTHLVRNALGGAARERVAGLLAIPSPESRRYRDDVRMHPTHPDYGQVRSLWTNPASSYSTRPRKRRRRPPKRLPTRRPRRLARPRRRPRNCSTGRSDAAQRHEPISARVLDT
ncbi:[pyruvate dehydrogenase (acetyl-transferring)]-phosphatase [Malassezia furfur]|uniref:[pyruvate dehydrogenase (Acetyl-transferring)]-phosphatase n=1 Tax=Malassezia furfur TaxID=55194 RepID=A0ABY8EPG4_MALFU|nr:[pyruvate dehydrogenase (acetyl-transferring)]-phosphatase [Malassezia furfur]